ncbi:hypothetical protein [Glycomyces sp. YM15]|uniref:hypothetical protein n=1 Tax=Glycomyces sp. YM15 TaxID=2800446 RepID=UPI001962BF55|nr:hypothetical protein [Glycomyces sp. YM15]
MSTPIDLDTLTYAELADLLTATQAERTSTSRYWAAAAVFTATPRWMVPGLVIAEQHTVDHRSAHINWDNVARLLKEGTGASTGEVFLLKLAYSIEKGATPAGLDMSELVILSRDASERVISALARLAGVRDPEGNQ